MYHQCLNEITQSDKVAGFLERGRQEVAYICLYMIIFYIILYVLQNPEYRNL